MDKEELRDVSTNAKHGPASVFRTDLILFAVSYIAKRFLVNFKREH